MDAQSVRLVRKSPHHVIKFYLIIYNSLQTIGWSILLLQFCNYYISSNQENNSLYQNIKWPLLISQTGAVLEIVHALTGIVPSNPIFTSMQIFSRLFVACGVIRNVVAAQNCMGLPIAMLAWSITEIARYAYYALNLIDVAPYFLMWFRYSAFIILYPVGGFGELLCLYAAQKNIIETSPNFLFFNFDNQYLSILLLILITPIFLRLYKHMFTQRRKVLGAAVGSDITKNK